MPWDALELLEAGSLFFGFWRFVFSSAYRLKAVSRWRERSRAGKVLGLLEAVISTTVGLFPLWLIWYLFM